MLGRDKERTKISIGTSLNMVYRRNLVMTVRRKDIQMPKYIVTNYVDLKEIYYIRAESEEEAFDMVCDSIPNETYDLSNNLEIDIDDSLDEAEESDLKERKLNE
tara:strand:- start:264 stop:575 length:312 start_codon:yes stop_codon:yes gene_type:complete